MSEIDDEMKLLKQRADDMGIKYKPNIGLDTLRERVNGALQTKTDLDKDLSKEQRYQKVRDKALALKRVKVTCLNPSKRDSHGEWFRIGNRAFKTICRFVEFNQEHDQPTHIEDVILKHMEGRKYSVVTHGKTKEGHLYPIKNKRKEFQIEYLPPLTEKELKDLASEQAKRGM